jgi:hypothetical protein
VTRTDIPKMALHDLSVMFPLDEKEMLTQNSPGRGGPLLTDFESFREDPTANIKSGGGLITPRPLKALAFRLDPCFPSIGLMEVKISACVPQIRIIFQRVSFGQTEDFAVHGIYDLTRPEFETLVKEVMALGDHSPEAMSAPLGIHPKIAKEGMAGPTAKAMKAIILRYAGRENLNRVARMTLPTPAAQWKFTAFDVKNDDLAGAAGIDPSLAADSVGGGSGSFMESDQSLVARNFTTDEAKALLVSSTAHFGNPYRTNAGINAPCAACHQHPSNVELEDAGLLKQFNSSSLAFKSNRPLGATDKDKLDLNQPGVVSWNFRMFGYFDKLPVISQRTVNETAAIADALIRHGYVK